MDHDLLERLKKLADEEQKTKDEKRERKYAQNRVWQKNNAAAYQREQYAKRTEEEHARRKDHVNKRKQQRKAEAIQMMGGKCADCDGIFHPAAFDFHHLDPSDKETVIRFSWSWDRLKEELQKCILLCANCHRIRHHS